jgi:GDP-L-fucose synthase
VNIGCGKDVSIKELAEIIVAEVGYEGELVFDSSKLDGTPRKLLDCSILNGLGWSPEISLTYGIKRTIKEFEILANDKRIF